jgi:RecJ-like exonuclease
MEETMQIPTQSLRVLVLVLLAAACGSASDPDSMPAANGGGVVQGTVMGGGSQSMRVAVPSSSAATSTDTAGGFVLADVPKGAAALQFSGGGRSATLATAPVVAGEFRRMTVSISGSSVTEHNEQTETEFEGTVDAIDGMVLTVAGRKVAVTDVTKIRKDDAAATFADLTLSTPVEVEGTLNADGTVTASEVSIEDKNEAERIAFVGMLTQIAGNTLTVGGRTVNVSSATVIVKGDATLTPTDLKVGDRLLVRGTVQADKSVNATRIRVLQREDEPEEMHVAGKVAAVDATTFTIGDTKITTDVNTAFEGTGFHSLADLKVGDFAFAEVIKQADGSLLAKEVKKFTPPMPPMPSM